jgi:hypothetical protein
LVSLINLLNQVNIDYAEIWQYLPRCDALRLL